MPTQTFITVFRLCRLPAKPCKQEVVNEAIADALEELVKEVSKHLKHNVLFTTEIVDKDTIKKVRHESPQIQNLTLEYTPNSQINLRYELDADYREDQFKLMVYFKD